MKVPFKCGQFAFLLKPYSKDLHYFTAYFDLVERIHNNCVQHNNNDYSRCSAIHFMQGAFAIMLLHWLNQVYLFVNDPQNEDEDLHQTVVHFNGIYMILHKRLVCLLEALLVPMIPF